MPPAAPAPVARGDPPGFPPPPAARGARGEPFDATRGRPLDAARGRQGEAIGPGPGGPGGFRGRGVERTFAPVTIRDVRLVATVGGRSRLVDTLLTLAERAITSTDERNGFIGKSMPYASVQHVTFSRSRAPRGAGGAEVDVAGGVPGGNFLSRGPWLWLTLETMDDRLVLRLDPPQVGPVLDLMQQRITVPIERYEGDPTK